jgi:hypothetical protein
MLRNYFLTLLLNFMYISFFADSVNYDLPLLPEKIVNEASQKAQKHNPDSGKFIPRNVWIAVRNASDTPAKHMLGPNGFIARNSKWKVHFCGNEEKDEFMEVNFSNSSFLWAYKILNPVIGTAKSELWRLAVLYVHGGMYMDDDANFGVPLDEVVLPTDKFIVGKESYDWADNCFRDDFPLSNHSLNQRFGEKNLQRIFDNRYFFNWALFSMPGNPLLYRIIQHVVHLIRLEYLGRSAIKMSINDARGKLLMCASTFPITLAAREMILEGKQEEIGIRVGSEQFREYDADMKAWNNDHNPQRWVKQMNKYKYPYLRHYAPVSIETLEGRLIQAQGQREIYLVKDGKRHSFPSFELFLQMQFSLDQVQHISPKIANTIPLGDPLPEKHVIT